MTTNIKKKSLRLFLMGQEIVLIQYMEEAITWIDDRPLWRIQPLQVDAADWIFFRLS